METKYVRVPFEVELAKEITNGTKDGKIVTRRGDNVRIVCWDYKSMSGNYPILALVDEGRQEEAIKYSENGRYNVYGYFSESCLDLMIEIPEYMRFEDGDVLYFKWNKKWIFIYKKDAHNTDFYVAVSDDGCIYFDDFIMDERYIKEIRRATETEKQKLIDALKESKKPKAKEYLKRFFPNHFNSPKIRKECEFKPFDKVLVRDNGGIWICSLFSHISKKQDRYKYITVTGSFEYCIPYNGQTAHLLGTIENYE